MPVLRRPEFNPGPGSNCNLMLDTVGTITKGATVAIGSKYTAVVLDFLPFNTIKVRPNPLAVPGAYDLIFRAGTTVT